MTQFESSAPVAPSTSPATDTAAGGGSSATPSRKPLAIEPTFCPVEVDSPFDTTEWELRTAAIKGENGQLLFEQAACEIPAAWSQLATNVVVSKYFYGEIHTPEREHSVKQLVHRVARTITDWGIKDGYFAARGASSTIKRAQNLPGVPKLTPAQAEAIADLRSARLKDAARRRVSGNTR